MEFAKTLENIGTDKLKLGDIVTNVNNFQYSFLFHGLSI